MKTQHAMFTAVLLTAVLTAGGCKDSEMLLTPELPTTAAFVIIDGDTVKTRKEKDFDKIKDKDPNKKNYIVVGDTVVLYKKPKLHTPPAKDPDLSKLKNNDDPDLKGKPLRMIAIGGSLTAGVRDGGYFNEGIETSYPNLIARQMKLKKFEQPLFDAADYNGFGRKARTGENWTGGPVPKFKAVENNSGVESVDEKNFKLKKIKENDIDIIAIPYSIRGYFGFNLIDKSALQVPFAYRLLNEKYDSFYRYYENGDFDFYLYESGYEDIVRAILTGDYIAFGGSTNTDHTFEQYPNWLTDSPELRLIRYLHQDIKEKKKSKITGFMANVPDVTEFPALNFTSLERIKTNLGYHTLYVNDYLGISEITNNDALFIPSPSIDSLLGVKVHPNLKKGLTKFRPLEIQDVLNTGGTGIKIHTNYLNTQTDNFKKKFGITVVDLKSLFHEIIIGNYITQDGIKVDASYPNGNFFNADGFSLTPFGQAIVANEFLKTINSAYKTDIPLIPTREYLDLK